MFDLRFATSALVSLTLALGACPDSDAEPAETPCTDGTATCDANATCFAASAEAHVCICNAGYVGDGATCQVDGGDLCAPDPCLNGGTCNDTDGTCACPAGFEGATCDVNIDDCSANPCLNGGTCIDGVDAFSCDCPSGFFGPTCAADNDPCADAPCFNGATCSVDASGGFECACAAGFEGTRCQIDTDDCASSPCANGGTCYDQVDGYVCVCAPGYEGATCDIDTDDCASGPCLNGGTCADAVDGFVCTCAAGFEGDVCGVNTDDCVAGACPATATCVDGVDSVTCVCPEGFTGAQCDEPIGAASCDPNPCLNGGTCALDAGAVTCTCTSGYEGDTCAINTDDCTSAPCLNGATCYDLVDAFACVCVGGYSGTTCEIAPDPCAAAPCLNGGTCDANGQAFTCTCAAGYEGTLCDQNIDDCAGEPCLNGGTCYDLVDAFACACPDGFQGATCDVSTDDCSPNPCLNGGACADLVGGFDCYCATGFTGDLCETNIDDCPTDPVCNQGVCVDGVASYTCDCEPGWTGDVCDTDVDECLTLPCGLTEACVNMPGSYFCQPASYVDPDATVSGDGTTWDTAFTTIAAAQAAGAKTIWVKAGTVTPEAPQSPVLTVAAGSFIYGGFDPTLTGTEGDIETRDLVAHATTLDGQFSADLDEDANHVVIMAAGSRLDGFTITNGRARLPDDTSGGGVLIADADGAVVSNVTLTNNTAATAGGGMACVDSANVTLSSITATSNTAVLGGAIALDACVATLTTSDLTNNVANGLDAGGAGVSAVGGSLSIQNSVISTNASSGPGTVRGGGVRAVGTDLHLVGTVLSGNLAAGASGSNGSIFGEAGGAGATALGGGVYTDAPASQAWSDVTLDGNEAKGGVGGKGGDGFQFTSCFGRGPGGPGGNGLGGGLYVADTGSVDLAGDVVINNLATAGNGGSQGNGCGSAGPGPPGSGAGGGFYRAGDLIFSAAEADLAGNIPNAVRPCPTGFEGYACELEDFEADDCAGVACGALDEACVEGIGVGTCTPVVMVDPNIAVPGDGSTWEAAYATIGDAVASGATAIWVKTGTLSGGSPVLAVPERTTIIGGFAAGLTGRSGDAAARQPADRTVLEGGAAVTVVTVSGRGSILDGFVIQNGLGNPGAGIRVSGVKLLHLRNLTVTANSAAGGNPTGAGLYCIDSLDVHVESVTFTNNDADGSGFALGGGATYDNCTGTVANSTFDGNVVQSSNFNAGGGGLAVRGGDMVVTGSTFSNNMVTAGLGGPGFEDCPLFGTCSYVAGGTGGVARGGGIYLDGAPSGAWDALVIASNQVTGGNGGDGIDAERGTVCSGPGCSGMTCNTSGASGAGGPGLGAGMFVTPTSNVTLTGGTNQNNTAAGGVPGTPGVPTVLGYDCSCNGQPGTLNQACVDAGDYFCLTEVPCGTGGTGANGSGDGGAIFTSAAFLTFTYSAADLTGNVPNTIAPCPAGFEGPDCTDNIDDCAPNPCLNGGSCTDGIADYTCSCVGPWLGKDCELSDCSALDCDDGNPCTFDGCEPIAGCVNKTFSCDDSLACSVDTCLETALACPGDSVSFESSCYEAIDATGAGVTWTSAKSLCEASGGHVVTVTSAGENDFVGTLVDTVCPGIAIPLGADDIATEGTWLWDTGEPFAYDNWAPGEPNNTAGNEHAVWRYAGGAWNDATTGAVASCYVCEYEPGALTGLCDNDSAGCP